MKLSIKIAIIIVLGTLVAVLATIFLVLPVTEDSTYFYKILLAFFLAVIPAAVTVWFLIHKLIIKPVLNLSAISKIIATGNLGQRVKISGLSEVKELGRNFNHVIGNLVSGMQNMANSLKNEKLKEKQLAENLREMDKAKSKDEALLGSIGDGVVAIDDQGKIILFNSAASKMIGMDQDVAVGRPYNLTLKFQSEEDKSPISDFINAVLKGEKLTGNNRMMLIRTNGEMLPVLHTTSPILNSQKQITGVVVILKDITQERELEKLKDEFVSLASHELRTPMTAIKGLISMIFEGDYGSVSDSLKDPLTDIAKSTERLIQLVNDMLDVSRIESGRIKFTLTELSVPELAAEVEGMLRPLAEQKNVRLEVISSPLNKVSADSDKVKEILINLANNALKFTDQGSVTISFRPNGRYAYISVTDSGIGISKENQEKLFEKFSQIGSSQNGRPPGTGLGLYISREFARRMGGELWIERSEPGQGSTFTFALPFANHVI